VQISVLMKPAALATVLQDLFPHLCYVRKRHEAECAAKESGRSETDSTRPTQLAQQLSRTAAEKEEDHGEAGRGSTPESAAILTFNGLQVRNNPVEAIHALVLYTHDCSVPRGSLFSYVDN
jgi:hypothetical protein